MPNGGSDNCGECIHNIGKNNNIFPPEAFCKIRQISPQNPFWTYCENFFSEEKEIIGLVYSKGIYEEGYTRIPWHHVYEPSESTDGICAICKKEYQEGLKVEIEGKKIRGFCCNAHYIRWWKQNHKNETLSVEYKWKSNKSTKYKPDYSVVLYDFGDAIEHKIKGIPKESFQFPLTEIIKKLKDSQFQKRHLIDNPMEKFRDKIIHPQNDCIWFYYKDDDLISDQEKAEGWMVVSINEIRELAFFPKT